jgi:hypothetical protein
MVRELSMCDCERAQTVPNRGLHRKRIHLLIIDILNMEWIYIHIWGSLSYAPRCPMQQDGVGWGSKVGEQQTGPNCRDRGLYRKPNFSDLNRKRSQEGDDAPSHRNLARRKLIMSQPRLYVSV